jgi:hypothetical protein
VVGVQFSAGTDHRLAVGPTQPPIQCLPQALSLEGKMAET